MKLETITNYLNPKNYTLSISENNLYINNYNKIEEITDEKLTIIIKNKKFKISGNNFKVKKMIDEEILLNGQTNKIEIININD